MLDRLTILVGFLCLTIATFSQDVEEPAGAGHNRQLDLADINKTVPDKFYQKTKDHFDEVEQQVSKKSRKYLTRFQKQELKIRKQLALMNPNFLLDSAKEQYQEMFSALKSKTAQAERIMSGDYIPVLDSLGTSLKFLCGLPGLARKTGKPLESLHLLQDKFIQTDQINSFITARKAQIREWLGSFTKLPAGLSKNFKEISKTAYYYSAHVKEYKEMLKDPEKLQRKALAVLTKIPAFQKFMKKNSQFAALFPPIDNLDPGQALAGLQTRASVQGMIQTRLSSGGANATQALQQNLAQAMEQLNALKDKVNKLGGSGGRDIDIPDFKPNNQKTKPFLKRLEYTFDVQFEKSSRLFPSTVNIGLGVGYKLNDKSVIGAGLAYKLGMGTIEHISFSHQGVGLRSYFDYKIKKSFYVSGGYEMNYNTGFKNIEQLRNYDAWQRSGLLGLSKRYSLGKKTGEMKLLWDFLSYQQVPRRQAIVYRVGYKLGKD